MTLLKEIGRSGHSTEYKYKSFVMVLPNEKVNNPEFVLDTIRKLVPTVKRYVKEFNFNHYPSEDHTEEPHLSLRLLVNEKRESEIIKRLTNEFLKKSGETTIKWQEYVERDFIVRGSAIATKLALNVGILDFDTSMSVVHSFLDNMGFSHEDEKKVYTKLLVGTQYDELKETGVSSCFFSRCPFCKEHRVFEKEDKCPECGGKMERYLMEVYSLEVKKEDK